MKKAILLIFLLQNTYINYAYVNWGSTKLSVVNTAFDICIGKESGSVKLYWGTLVETNNDYFQVWRDDGSGWVCIASHINGCGTCALNSYSYTDNGPFSPNITYHYKVRSVSNWGALNDYNFGNVCPYITFYQSKNWINQVTSSVESGYSSNNLNDYSWYEESNTLQGVNISLYNFEKVKIYLEENNFILNFNLWGGPNDPMFIQIDMEIDYSGYSTIYSGSSKISYKVPNSSIPNYTTLSANSNHTMKIRFSDPTGTTYYREYDLYIVPRSSKLFKDNYCNTMRVWEGSDPSNEIPLILSEGFDAYNTKPEQYYREAGKDLINCLLSKGFKIYVINYRFNSQFIQNNAAAYSSAVKYISSINGGKQIIAAGISMGGIIARYALTKAEDVGNALPASILLTLDSPHQGAIISRDLQDYRVINTSGDDFAEFASKNFAARQLMIYNAYGSMQTIFQNELESLNGDGYPHLTKNIAVSFSSTTPNQISGIWLHIHLTGFAGLLDYDVYASNEEKVAGSLLPDINVDPTPMCVPLTSKYYWCAHTPVQFLKPWLDQTIIINQYQNPTFISHNSSLDIVNGVSKFPTTIIPSQTSHHDVVPTDIIEPLVKELIVENLYIQNKTVTKNYISSKNMYAGDNVTTSIPTGNVLIASNSNITFNSGEKIYLKDGFRAQYGSYFNAKIGINCNNIPSSQQSIQQSPLAPNDTIITADTVYAGIIKPDVSQNNADTAKVADSDNGKAFESALGERKISIYPNPTKGELRVDISNFNPDSKGTIYIVDMSGKVVYQNTNIFASNVIDISHTARTTYVLRLVIDGKSKEWVVVKN